MSWIYADTSGETSVFLRSGNSENWEILRRGTGVRDRVNPSFWYDGVRLTISFPTTPRVYNLFNDGTGYFSDPGHEDHEGLVWDLFVD